MQLCVSRSKTQKCLEKKLPGKELSVGQFLQGQLGNAYRVIDVDGHNQKFCKVQVETSMPPGITQEEGSAEKGIKDKVQAVLNGWFTRRFIGEVVVDFDDRSYTADGFDHAHAVQPQPAAMDMCCGNGYVLWHV